MTKKRKINYHTAVDVTVAVAIAVAVKIFSSKATL